jgi:hypothetical protein
VSSYLVRMDCGDVKYPLTNVFGPFADQAGIDRFLDRAGSGFMEPHDGGYVHVFAVGDDVAEPPPENPETWDPMED